MNRTYEDMSKQELITLVKRLAKQHDEWSAEAKRLRAWKKLVSDIVQQQDGSHLREMLKEMIE